MPDKLLFLTLKIFSAKGGIEKVCKIAGKAFWENYSGNGGSLHIFSMHDNDENVDERYFSGSVYKSFNAHKISFGLQAIKQGLRSETVILSHINLLLFGYIIKILSPGCKLVLFAHGIEVWKPFNFIKKWCLAKCDVIICVSHFTKQKIVAANSIPTHKCIVVNNCLDPYLPIANAPADGKALLAKYGLTKNNTVLLTLSRLSAHDRDKGYKKVLEALSLLKKDFPDLVYIIAGRYKAAEKQWLDALIAGFNLQDAVIFTGFIPDNQLADHFLLSDLYIMPSTKEGFGIIFIEAMYYGLPVIAGNLDGSVDALANGELGLLVNPLSVTEITAAIRKVLANPAIYTPGRHKVLQYFSYDTYKPTLLQAIYNG